MKSEVYRHYKGNLYLVLLCATFDPWQSRALVDGEDWISVFTVNSGYSFRATPGDFCSGQEVFRARYTGATRKVVDGELLAVYVGLYDNPHGNTLCARPVSEWHQEVSVVDSSRSVPRYARVTT